jgi:phospholipid/cholesterol/gamma-HCH transport system ATP-binding protein
MLACMAAKSDQLNGTNAIVRLVNISKQFGSHEVLRNITLDFPKGKCTVVMGPSGCGKTVLIKHIVGLHRPNSGEVWFEDKRIDRLSDAELVDVRKKVGFLFQMGALFDSMSLRENVAFPLVEHTKQSKEERDKRVVEVVKTVGLLSSIDKMPAELSGGQKKRAALARAIVLDPTLILYDEPTTGLDPIRAAVISELIKKLQRELHVTSIVVTHDLTSAFAIADAIVMLDEGRVIAQGAPEEIRNADNPIVRRFMKGEPPPEELAEIGGLNDGNSQPGNETQRDNKDASS